MVTRIGNPDRSKAGPLRGYSALSVPPVPRAIAADLATAADTADALNTVTPRGSSITGSDYLALVVDGRVEPLTVDNLCAYLESRYVLTPIP